MIATGKQRPREKRERERERETEGGGEEFISSECEGQKLPSGCQMEGR